MTRPRIGRAVTALAAAALLVAACGSDKKSSDTAAPTTASGGAATTAASETTTGGADTTAGGAETTAGSTATTAGAATTAAPGTTAAAATTAPAAAAWAVDTSQCADEASATEKITGTVKIGSVMPLTGGVAAAAFAPVAEGFKAYIDYANEKGLLGDVKAELTIEDDQYSKDLTPAAVSKLLDGGVNLVSGIIGTPDNAAVRDTLNDECVPQLNALTGSPAWGDVANYPWTTGLLVPYDEESAIYAGQMKADYPSGAKVALFSVNSEFGQVYADAFKELAPKNNLTIVDEQTVEDADSNPPTSQITSIASKKPDVIMAVPLGAGCVSFLNELAAQKAQNAGWDPAVYITNTCASSLILGASGASADGIISSGNLKDPGDPRFAADPKMKEYIDYMTARGKADIMVTAATGWNAGDATLAILSQAAKSPDGLTRASIIDAARNFDYTPALGRDGVVFHSHGEADPFLAQSLQVGKYDATAKTFTDLGPLNTDFEK